MACAAAIACSQAEPPGGSLEGAAAALGTENVHSLQFSGSGRMFSVGQPPTADEPWPPVDVREYTALINYDTESARLELVRFMGPEMPRGGGAPFTGEQRQVQVVSGEFAWNVPAGGGQGAPPATAAATPAQGAAPAAGAAPPQGAAPAAAPAPAAPPAAQPQPAAVTDRRVNIWLTPHGFIKAAAANKATTSPVEGGTEVSFTVAGRRVVGVINPENQVARVQTWLDNPVMGDMLLETTYSDYRDFNGLQFPGRIAQTQGGHPSFELTVSSAELNPTADIAVPDEVRNAPAPAAPTATSERLSDGVFWITGGSHHSLAVDMGDHIAVVEGPLNEARSEAAIAETKRVIPDKPIRYIVNTHIHFDHSGGLRTYVDEGATVVTHQANQAFYEKAWATPRTLGPDRLSKSGKAATFQGVTDRGELKGTNNRVIELHVLQGNPHNEQILVAWLPAERILFQSDMMTPPAPNATVPPPSPTLTNFYDNLQRLKIQPRQIVGGHGNRVGTMADLNKVAGRGTT
jgi:glyoxylase-like metal-dependent hydrolase (beta-lactamase superfamily II)